MRICQICNGLNRLDFYNITLPGMSTAIYPIHRTSFRSLLNVAERLGVNTKLTVNASMARVRPVWDIVSAAGYQVGVVGGYMTWPAEQGVSGFIISENAYERYQKKQEIESYLAPNTLEVVFDELKKNIFWPISILGDCERVCARWGTNAESKPIERDIPERRKRKSTGARRRKIRGNDRHSGRPIRRADAFKGAGFTAGRH